MFTKVEMNFFYRGLIPCSIKILLSVHPPHLSRVLKIWDSVACVQTSPIFFVARRQGFGSCSGTGSSSGNSCGSGSGSGSSSVSGSGSGGSGSGSGSNSNGKKLLYFHDRIIIQYCKSMHMTIKI